MFDRVEELEHAIKGLSVEAAARRIEEMRLGGEPSTVLAILAAYSALPPLPSPLGEGDVVAGDYTLQKQIGEGGMGSVWLASEKTMIEREVALKMIHPALISPAMKQRFCGEMKILGKLTHRSIVTILHAAIEKTSDGREIPFYTMHYIDGAPLAAWAAEQRARPGVVLRLMAKVCLALRHAHDRKIVHRDLKPGNILVREEKEGEQEGEWQPVILDFGVARFAGSTEESEGGFSGTPQYAPPEQHLGRDRDFGSGESVDVYASGAVTFEALTGRRLFDFRPGASIGEMREEILHATPRRVRDFLPDCPPEVDEIVARAVRRDPADRYHSISGFARALARAAQLCEADAKPAPAWEPRKGAMLPGRNWKLTTRLGKGSAGEVWAAEDEALGERRVFKFCSDETKAQTLRREMTLYRLLKGQVGHDPHFIQLLELSLEEPPWYLAMEYADAQDLESWFRKHPAGVDMETAIEIVAQAAEALHTAHKAGILHRDIKPGNLLVRSETRNGAPPSVHVMLTDFGIGQIMAEELAQFGTRGGFTKTVLDTQRSSLAGTIMYVAPEMLEGAKATEQSDIYSLGIVLWQLLSGNLQGALDPADWLEKIHDPLIREDLRRCLTGTRERRWTSAAEFAASLRDLPRRRELETQKRLARERATIRKGALRVGVPALVIIVIVSALAWVAWRQSVQARRMTETAISSQARSALGELQGLAKLGSSVARPRLLQELPKLDIPHSGIEPDLRNTAISIFALPVFEAIPAPLALRDGDRITDDGEKLIVRNANGQPELVDSTLSPPRRRIIDTSGLSFSNIQTNLVGNAAGAKTSDDSLQLWWSKDFFGKDPLEKQIAAGPYLCFTFSPTTLSRSKKTAVAAACPDGGIDLILLQKPLHPPSRIVRKSAPGDDQFPESVPASMIAFSRVPEGTLASAGPGSNILSFWTVTDTPAGTISGQFTGCALHKDTITCLSWSPLGLEIATGAKDGFVRLWRSLPTGVTPQRIPLQLADLGEPIRELVWNADGTRLAVLLDSGNIRILKARALDQTPDWKMDGTGALHIAFIESNILLAWDSTRTLAWGETDVCFAQRIISSGAPKVAYHHDGALTASVQERVCFLKPNNLALTGGFKTTSGGSAMWWGDTLLFLNEQKWTRAQTIRAEHPACIKLPKLFDELPGADECLSSPQGLAVAGVFDGDLQRLTPDGQTDGITLSQELPSPILATSDVESMEAAVDGDDLVIYRHDREPIETRRKLPGILGLSFAPFSGLLACRTEQGVMFVDTEQGRTAFAPAPAPGASSTPLAFSPDGRWLAVSGPEHEILLGAMPPASACWREGGAALERIFAKHVTLTSPNPGRIASLHWNPSSSRLACGTAAGFVQSWNVSLLRRQLRLLYLDWDAEVPLDEQPALPITLH